MGKKFYIPSFQVSLVGGKTKNSPIAVKIKRNRFTFDVDLQNPLREEPEEKIKERAIKRTILKVLEKAGLERERYCCLLECNKKCSVCRDHFSQLLSEVFSFSEPLIRGVFFLCERDEGLSFNLCYKRLFSAKKTKEVYFLLTLNQYESLGKEKIKETLDNFFETIIYFYTQALREEISERLQKASPPKEVVFSLQEKSKTQKKHKNKKHRRV